MEKQVPSFYQRYANTNLTKVCIHEDCPYCNGTNKKDDGSICEHFFICPCKKCKKEFLIKGKL